ncbi:MAG: serine hydrolase [bacterium]|nr:serine hydrolase [bacterium]
MIRLLLVAALVAPSCSSTSTSMASAVRELLPPEESGLEVAVAYRDLGDDSSWSIDPDVEFHAASTMKVAVLIELFRQEAAGTLDLDAPVTVKNAFASIVDGSPYSLTRADDGEQELYEHIGSQVPVRELARRMIVRSSNLATNLLVELAGADNIQRTIEELGTTKMRVLRGVEDIPAYRAGLSNTTTAHDLMVLMTALGTGAAVSSGASEEMIEILAGQEYNDLIPAALPPGTRVAHKTGWITGIRHDAALVMPEGEAPYVLVVLTRGYEDPHEAAATIVRLARTVHASR